MSSHRPVLVAEMAEMLAPKGGELYIDATYGGGGYTQAIFEMQPKARVIGLDRDPDAEKRSERHAKDKRFQFLRTTFGDIEEAVRANTGEEIDGIVLDIGVSSFQIDEKSRGFSFIADGPLDMRMDNESGQSAADIVNNADEKDLADIFFRYGEEKHSRRIAKAIVAARPVMTTLQLANLIEKNVPKSGDKAHPATRCFQALRIAVNDELGELERALHASENLLKDGGRLIVVTFHSLEDRIVKQFFIEHSGKTAGPSRFHPAANQNSASFHLLTRKPVTPSAQEIAENPRARSAKLRAGIKIGKGEKS